MNARLVDVVVVVVDAVVCDLIYDTTTDKTREEYMPRALALIALLFLIRSFVGVVHHSYFFESNP